MQDNGADTRAEQALRETLEAAEQAWAGGGPGSRAAGPSHRVLVLHVHEQESEEAHAPAPTALPALPGSLEGPADRMLRLTARIGAVERTLRLAWAAIAVSLLLTPPLTLLAAALLLRHG